jgi:hypothetical protein
VQAFAWLLNRIGRGLAQLLPVDQRNDLQEYRAQLNRESFSNLAFEVKVLRATLGAWRGAVDLLRDIPGEVLAWMDPRRTGITVYQKFGRQAVDQLEDEFIEDDYRKALPNMRFCGILMLAFYGVLAGLDFLCLPETREVAWGIRTVVCGLIVGTTLISFYAPFFKRFHQLITAMTVLLAGLGIVLIIVLSHPTELGNTTYYAGLHVLIMYINLLSGLRFFPALWVTMVLVGSYESAELLLNSAIMTDRATGLAFISNSFFLISDITLGSVSCNMLKRSERISFMIRYALSHSFKDMLRYFDYEDPQTFLEKLSKIRYKPKTLVTFMGETYGSKQTLVLPTRFLENDARPLLWSAFETDSGTNSDAQQETNASPASWRLAQSIESLNEWLRRLNPSSAWQRVAELYSGQSNQLNQEFSKDYFYGAIGCIRMAVIWGVLNYAIFAIDDYYCLPESRGVSLAIRISMCTVAALLYIASFSESFFEKNYQLMVAATVFLAGCGINVMIAISTPGEIGYATYYGGLIHVTYLLFFLCRIRFKVALVIGIANVAIYEIIAIYLQDLLASPAEIALLINNSLFLISALIIGAISCNVIERNNWLDFLTMRVISYKASELLAYYEVEKPTPRQLLDLISNIRHSPRKLEEYLLKIEKMKQGKG